MAPPRRKGGDWAGWFDHRSDAGAPWKCGRCGCAKNLGRFWHCKQRGGKKKDCDATIPSGDAGDQWTAWERPQGGRAGDPAP
eukprot:6600892-Pyramimonas_sp.AAC.1